MARSWLNIVANVFNLLVALLMIAAAVFICWDAVLQGLAGFRDFVVGASVGIFGILLMIIEVWVPHFVRKYFRFLVTFFGRGVWLIFLGCLVLGPPASSGIELFYFCAGIFIIAIGLLFIVLEFVKISRPKPILVQREEHTDSLYDLTP